MKRIFYLAFLMLLIIPFISAGNYGAGIYGSGLYGVGEAPTITTGGGGGGRGLECVQSSDCNENEYCFENDCYDAQCSEDSECDIEAGEKCWDLRCVKLFDIKIIEIESPVTPGEDFEITYFLKGMANVSDDVEIYFWIEKDGEIVSSGLDTVYIGSFEEKTDTIKIFMPSDATPGEYAFFAEIRYQDYQAQTYRTIESSLGVFQLFDISFSLDDSVIDNSDGLSAVVTFESFGTEVTPVELTFIILDANGNEIYSERESISVMTEEVLRKSFKGLDLPSGKYTLVLETLYNVDVFDRFEQDFEIRGGTWITGNVIDKLGEGNIWIVLAILATLFLIYAERKKIKKSIINEEKWVRKHVVRVSIFILLILLIGLFYYFDWFWVIGWIVPVISWCMENWVYLVIGLVVILFGFVSYRMRWRLLQAWWEVKSFVQHHRVGLLVTVGLIILVGIISYLFYAGISTVAQLRDLGKSIVNGIITGYSSTAKWSVNNWVYLVIGAGIILFGCILYILRKQLFRIGRGFERVVRELKQKRAAKRRAERHNEAIRKEKIKAKLTRERDTERRIRKEKAEAEVREKITKKVIRKKPKKPVIKKSKKEIGKKKEVRVKKKIIRKMTEKPKKKIRSPEKSQKFSTKEIDWLTKQRHPKIDKEIARIKQKHKPYSQLNKQEEK